jgi:hypothetical protein
MTCSQEEEEEENKLIPFNARTSGEQLILYSYFTHSHHH